MKKQAEMHNMLNKTWYVYIILVWILILGVFGSGLIIGGGDKNNFNGSIDELIIIGRAISIDEVKALYNSKENPLNFSRDNLSNGNYSYKAMAIEVSGIYNETEERIITIGITENIAPEIINIEIEPDEPRLDDTLSCFVDLNDPDSTIINVSFIWFINESYNDSYDSLKECNLSQSSRCSSDVDLSGLLFNISYICSAKASDSLNDTLWINSSEVRVLNNPPTVTLISPTSMNETTNRTPVFVWEGYDEDGDTLIYDLNITCFPSCFDDNRNIAGITLESYTLSEVLNYLYDGDLIIENYFYNWTVRAFDGQEYSEPAVAWNFTIKSLLDITLDPSSVDFGEGSPGIEKTTVQDNSPAPLIIHNHGNTYVNISFRAENHLWQAVQEESNYSRIKADNLAEITGAFDEENSRISWLNINKDENVTIIADLNYSSIKNKAEIDFNITIPHAEPPGERSANYTLFAKVSRW